MARDLHIVYFLTECKLKTGSGHLSRCLSLRDAFIEKNFQTQFIIDSDGSCDFKNAAIDPLILDWKSNLDILKKHIKKESIVVFDSYLATKNQLEEISNYFSHPIFIADSKMNYYPKGIIIVGSSFATKLNLLGTNKAKFLLGIDYILLRKEFWDVEEKQINPVQNSILITLGEFDPENISEYIAIEIHRHYPEYNISIITKQKTDLSKNKSFQVIHKRLNAHEMKKLMLINDLLICNGGQTLNECIRTGTPSIAIEIASNQHQNIETWTEKNVSLGINANKRSKSTVSQLIKNIEYLKTQSHRKKINTLSIKYLDGQGARKACEDILNYYKIKN